VFLYFSVREQKAFSTLSCLVGLLHQRGLSRSDPLAPAVGTLRVPGRERRVGDDPFDKLHGNVPALAKIPKRRNSTIASGVGEANYGRCCNLCFRRKSQIFGEDAASEAA
jgi:hypothetical protein